MAPSIRHALVLTAGLGTRLRPLTLVRAKPAIPLAGEPLVRRIVGRLAAHGVTELVLNLHYRPETVAAILGDGSDLEAHVRYSWEYPRLLGSAGGPRLARADHRRRHRSSSSTATRLTDVDLGAAQRRAHRIGALVTMALVPNLQPITTAACGWMTTAR